MAILQGDVHSLGKGEYDEEEVNRFGLISFEALLCCLVLVERALFYSESWRAFVHSS